jgi:hypothetical protein
LGATTTYAKNHNLGLAWRWKKTKKNFQASWVNTEDAKIIFLLRADKFPKPKRSSHRLPSPAGIKLD